MLPKASRKIHKWQAELLGKTFYSQLGVAEIVCALARNYRDKRTDSSNNRWWEIALCSQVGVFQKSISAVLMLLPY